MNTTETKIISAAIKVLTNQPDAAIEEIISNAKVSRRTFYKYYKSKFDLIKKITLHSFNLINQKLTPAFLDSKLSPLEKIKAVFDTVIPMGNYYGFLTQFPSTHNDPTIKKIYDEQLHILEFTIKDAQKENQLNPKIPSKWITEQIDALIYAGWSALEKGQLSETEILKLAFNSFINGTGTHQK